MSSSLKISTLRKIQELERKVRERQKQKQTKKPPFRGKWVMWSDKNPRWDAEGTSEMGGTGWPEETVAKIKELKKKLGEEPPDDLNWTYKLD